MTHPLTAFVCAAGLGLAIGAGAIAVLPEAKPAPPAHVRIAPLPVATERAEPDHPLTEAERVEALQRRLAVIGDEQRALTDELKSLAREGKPR